MRAVAAQGPVQGRGWAEPQVRLHVQRPATSSARHRLNGQAGRVKLKMFSMSKVHFMSLTLFRFTLVFMITLAAPAYPYGSSDGDANTANTALSNATTQKVVRTLTRGVRGCQKLDKVYRYDCYRQTYGLAAKQMNGMPAYAGAQKVLIDVEKVLERTIERNTDSTKPRVRRGLQRFRPIKPAAVPRAKRDFLGALNKAEKQLLRSSGPAKTHYVRIAEAINTNKVLLRSAMLFLRAPVGQAAALMATGWTYLQTPAAKSG